MPVLDSSCKRTKLHLLACCSPPTVWPSSSRGLGTPALECQANLNEASLTSPLDACTCLIQRISNWTHQPAPSNLVLFP